MDLGGDMGPGTIWLSFISEKSQFSPEDVDGKNKVDYVLLADPAPVMQAVCQSSPPSPAFGLQKSRDLKC